MKLELPDDFEDIKKSVLAPLLWFRYGAGLFDFGLAILFLVVLRPKDRWMIVYDLNIMFCATLGAYWITKAEDLRKTLK
jgi:hypothetical protein